MNSKVVEIEELGEMLSDDIKHGITRWSYQGIWKMLGYDEHNYPRPNTLPHFKWGQRRGQKLIAINKYFERKKDTVRIMIAHGTNGNGESSLNEWRAVPKEEALNWMALESAKKIMGPMVISVARAIGYSNAEEFSLETRTMFKSLAAMIDSTSSVILSNSQSINGLDKATIKELQKWGRRKAQKYRKLLGEGKQAS